MAMPRLVVNRFFNPHLPESGPGESPRAFHRTLPTYEPTPLLRLPALATRLGIETVHLKDESQRFGLGAFKSLGGSWALQRLLQGGTDARVVSTASSGNHGRGVAWAARLAGLRAVVFLAEGTSPRRVELIRSEGADVVFVAGTYDEAVAECSRRSKVEGWQVVSDVGYEGYDTIPLWVGEGYRTMLEEIEEQLADRGAALPDLVVVQGGVGCLAGAVVGWAGGLAHHAATVVVEPTEADCLLESAASDRGSLTASRGSLRTRMGGLNCRLPSTTAWPVVRACTKVFLTVTDEAVGQTAFDLAEGAEGDPEVSAGMSGAAGAAGLVALCTEPSFAEGREAVGLSPRTRALVINTEAPLD